MEQQQLLLYGNTHDHTMHGLWISFRRQLPQRLSHNEVVIQVICCDDEAITVRERQHSVLASC